MLDLSKWTLNNLRNTIKQRRVSVVIGGALFLAGVLAPVAAGKYIIDGVVDYFLIYLSLAESYDILGGFAGYVDLGIVLFFGAGAYSFGILYYVEHANFLEAIVVSALFSAVLGYLVSFPMFRLRGFYFAVATLSLVPLGQYIVLAPALGRWTNGVGGINGIPADYVQAYYGIFAFAIITISVAFLISKSSFGLALGSIREDEEVAESSGINTRRLKRLAMVISATLAGVTGCLFAWSQGSIIPTFVFSLYLAFIPVTFALFGGTGTIVGPILGTGVYSLIDYVLRSGPVQSSSLSFLGLFEQAIVGIFLIVVGLFAPDGILGLSKRWRARTLRSKKPEKMVQQQAAIVPE